MGRRQKGRPKKSWRNEVNETMEKRPFQGDWGDKLEWRKWLTEGRAASYFGSCATSHYTGSYLLKWNIMFF